MFLFLSGVLQADPGVIREHNQIFRLFCHECQRVFHDRLINKTDKKYFYGILSEMASKHFSKVVYIHKYVTTLQHYTLQDISAEKFEESPIIFGDYMKMGASQSDRIYEELVDMKKVANILSEVFMLHTSCRHIMYIIFCYYSISMISIWVLLKR